MQACHVLWKNRKVAALLNGLTAIIFIPAFAVGWALMKGTGRGELYGLVSSSLVATIAVSLLYATPVVTLYWLNAKEPAARLGKKLLSASLVMVGVLGGCETLIALFSLSVERSGRYLWAHTVTGVAINPHGFFLMRVLGTIVLVVLALTAGLLSSYRQRQVASL